MADIKPAGFACLPRITHDVDCAAIAQQMVELRALIELINPTEIDQKKPARIFGRRPDAVEIHVVAPVIRAHTHKIPFVAYYVDQFELPEEGSDRREPLADL